MTVRQVLINARNRLHGHFVKDHLYWQGDVCAIGALYDQGISRLTGDVGTTYARAEVVRRYPEIDELVRKAGQCQGSYLLELQGLKRLAHYNDAGDEKRILDLFDKMIELADD